MKYGFQTLNPISLRDVGLPNVTLRTDASYCMRVVSLFVYYSPIISLEKLEKKREQNDGECEEFFKVS